jgi:hypothetical protein
MTRRNPLTLLPDDGESNTPFRDYAEKYYAAGWIPLRLDPREKEPPPNKTTGRHPIPSWDIIKSWIKTAKDHNIGVRMPDGMVGIDVDAYKEGGRERLAELQRDLGPLPVTWVSSARSDDVSGIRYFRIPPGLHLPGNFGTGIDVIQFRHRYSVVAPSIHPNGERYKWYAPGKAIDGQGTCEPPVLKKVKSSR